MECENSRIFCCQSSLGFCLQVSSKQRHLSSAGSPRQDTAWVPHAAEATVLPGPPKPLSATSKSSSRSSFTSCLQSLPG